MFSYTLLLGVLVFVVSCAGESSLCGTNRVLVSMDTHLPGVRQSLLRGGPHRRPRCCGRGTEQVPVPGQGRQRPSGEVGGEDAPGPDQGHCYPAGCAGRVAAGGAWPPGWPCGTHSHSPRAEDRLPARGAAGQKGADREQVRAASHDRRPSGAGRRRWREFSPEASLVHLSVGDAARILLARPAGPGLPADAPAAPGRLRESPGGPGQEQPLLLQVGGGPLRSKAGWGFRNLRLVPGSRVCD